MFMPYQIEGGRDLPLEYLPCSAMQPTRGMTMTFSSGKLAKANGTTKPTYISAFEADAALAAGTLIPVWRVEDDIIWKTTNSAAFTNVALGAKVTIATNGLQVTATTDSGVAEVVAIEGTATGSDIKVRF